MDLYQGLGISLGLIALIISWCKLTIARADAIVRRWALENGFELLHFKRCFYKGGFSWLTTSRNQIVYEVQIRDPWKEERSGWLRCGNYFGVIFSNEAEVRWKYSPRNDSQA
jgi:hypothetical protein